MARSFSTRIATRVSKRGCLAWPVRVIGKLTGIERRVRWSQAKRIDVLGPHFWGQYDVYVDVAFNVAFFLPKADATLHVFVGNVVEATQWLKYGSSGDMVLDQQLDAGALQWKINPDQLLFRGRMLPPDERVYRGNVLGCESFRGVITRKWVDKHAREVVASMAEKGSP
jgi:hypothetical protein